MGILRRFPNMKGAAYAYHEATVSDYDAYLTAYWDLQETSANRADSVGSNTAVEEGTVGYSAAGKFGNAAVPDGVFANRLAVTDHADISPTTSVAVSFWVKASYLNPISFNVPMGKNLSYRFFNSGIGNAVTFEVFQSDGVYKYAIFTGQLDVGSFHHLVGIAYDGVVYLYHNGTEYTGTTYDKTIKDNAEPLWLGGDKGGNVPWDGLIEHVALWKNIGFADTIARRAFAAELWNGSAGLIRVGGVWVEAA